MAGRACLPAGSIKPSTGAAGVGRAQAQAGPPPPSLEVGLATAADPPPLLTVRRPPEHHVELGDVVLHQLHLPVAHHCRQGQQAGAKGWAGRQGRLPGQARRERAPKNRTAHCRRRSGAHLMVASHVGRPQLPQCKHWLACRRHRRQGSSGALPAAAFPLRGSAFSSFPALTELHNILLPPARHARGWAWVSAGRPGLWRGYRTTQLCLTCARATRRPPFRPGVERVLDEHDLRLGTHWKLSAQLGSA